MRDRPQPGGEYYAKLADPRWQKLRLEIFERDAWTCQNIECGIGIDGGRPFHAHHDTYTTDDPWDEPPEHLRTLCEICHGAEHQGLGIPVEQFEMRLQRLREVFSVAHRMVVKVIGEAEALKLIKVAPNDYRDGRAG